LVAVAVAIAVMVMDAFFTKS